MYFNSGLFTFLPNLIVWLDQFQMIDNFSGGINSHGNQCSILEKTNLKQLGLRKRAYLLNCGR